VDNDELNVSKPPLNLLLNPDYAMRQRPWDISLRQLLHLLSQILQRFKLRDLRLCGTAVLTSALIYRLKVETLFLFERLKEKRGVRRVGEIPPLIQLPFRYELAATSIDDLIKAFEVVLNEIIYGKKEKKTVQMPEVEPIIEIDTFEAFIKNALEAFKQELFNALLSKSRLSFNNFVKGKSLIERVRAFILLLFVASEGLIELEQVIEEDEKEVYEDILIMPKGMKVGIKEFRP
jgi:segregation and condensation protein A